MLNFKSWTVCHISLFVTFVLSGLVINLIQFILFVTIGQLSRTLFRKINFCFNWMINAQVLFLCTWWSKSEGILYGETEEALDKLGKENGLVTMNHHYEVDWLFGWMASDAHGILGNSRVFVKKMLAYVPVVGWSWLMSDVVFLARDWEKDRLKLDQGVKQLCAYPDPMWLLLFAEGTRVNAEKLEASRQFAQQRNLPLLKHHLIPRTKGFIAAMMSLDKSKVPAIYDVTLAMPVDDVATMSTMLLGKKATGHMYVRRFDVNTLPTDEKGLTSFLMKLYSEKDELKENFLTTGAFPARGKFPVQRSISLPRRLPVLLNTIILNGLISVPLAAKIGLMITTGSFAQMTIAVVIIAALYFALRKFINLTKISKASAYGKKSD